MRASLLDDLRCPYCGGTFEIIGRARDDASPVDYGVLLCACCAYPIVDGIPVVALGDEISTAIGAIEQGRQDEALRHVIDLPPERHGTFDAVRADDRITFARAVRALLPDGEGDYYVLRYGDPTFIVADAVTRTVASLVEPTPRTRWLDVCGGCGHLTTTLADVARTSNGDATATLLDRSFWRVWLAQRFLAPDADVICCDGNVPLPLATGCASLAVCNDAIHYIWGKRLLASELQRVTTWAGAVVVTHAHNALGDNATAGNTLSPAGYAALFDRHHPVAARDDELLEWALGRAPVEWRTDATTCGAVDAVALVAMANTERLAGACVPPVGADGDGWTVNPLLSAKVEGGRTTLSIAWPSEHYANEFSAVRGYLDEDLQVDGDVVADAAAIARTRRDLVARRVLLKVPGRYM